MLLEGKLQGVFDQNFSQVKKVEKKGGEKYQNMIIEVLKSGDIHGYEYINNPNYESKLVQFTLVALKPSKTMEIKYSDLSDFLVFYQILNLLAQHSP